MREQLTGSGSSLQAKKTSEENSSQRTVFLYISFLILYAFAFSLPMSFITRVRAQFFTPCNIQNDDCDGKYAYEAFYHTLFDSINYFLSFILTSFWARKSDIFGRKYFLAFCFVLTSFPFLTFSLTEDVWYYYFFKALVGIGGNMFAFLDLVVSDYVKPEERSKFFGYTYAFYGLGFAIGPYSGSLLEEAYSEKLVFFLAFMMLFLGAFLILLLPESRQLGLSETEHSMCHQLQTIGNSRLLQIAGFILFTSAINEVAGIELNLNYFADALDLSGHPETVFNRTFILICGIGLPVSMALVYPFLVSKLTLFNLLLLSCALSGVHRFLYALLPLLNETYPIYITAGMSGVSNMVGPTVYATVSSGFSTQEQSQALGYLASVESLTKCIGPVLFGFIYKETHNVFSGIWLITGGILSFFGACAVLWLPKSKKYHTTEP